MHTRELFPEYRSGETPPPLVFRILTEETSGVCGGVCSSSLAKDVEEGVLECSQVPQNEITIEDEKPEGHFLRLALDDLRILTPVGPLEEFHASKNKNGIGDSKNGNGIREPRGEEDPTPEEHEPG
eukprot:Trichotokara_eunicae@DN10820_c0_g1_i1.p1